MKASVMDLGGLLNGLQQRAEAERAAKMTPEERLAEAKKHFETLLDGHLAPCKDPQHHQAEGAAAGLLRGMFQWGTLPEPVANAVIAVLVSDAMHYEGEMGDNLKWLVDPRTVVIAQLVAGATLRAAQGPDTTGVKRTDGQGIYL